MFGATRPRTALRLAVLPALTLALLASLPRPLSADVIHLEGGGRLEGEIVYEDAEMVRITVHGVEQTVERDDIVRIERVKTPAQEFDERLETVADAQAAYDLGVWARDQGLSEQAARAFRRAVEMDGGHKEAREALGFHWFEGRWMSEEEYQRAQGKVYVEGRGWVSREEVDRIRGEETDRRRAEAEARLAEKRAEFEGVPWSEANVAERPHYIVRCNSTRKVADHYADFMEKLYAKYDKIFGAFPKQFPDDWEGKARGQPFRNTVYINRTHDEFMTMLQQPGGVGGFYRPEAWFGLPPRIVCAFHGPFGDTGDTHTVLAHEGTHQFEHLVMRGDFMEKPIWLIEGLACLFGDGHRVASSGEIEIIDPPDRLSQLLAQYAGTEYLPVKHLIRTPHMGFSGGHYAYGWAVIDYLTNKTSPLNPDKKGEKKVGREAFNAVFAANVDGVQTPEQFEAIIKEKLGKEIDAFDADLRAFILTKSMPTFGEIKGSEYTTNEFRFRVSRPATARGWAFQDKDLNPNEKIALVNEKTTGRVGIIAMGNGTGGTSKDWCDIIVGALSQRLDGLAMAKEPSERLLGGFPGYEFNCSGTEKASETGSERVRAAPQKYKVIVVATVDKVYILRFQADADRFGDSKDDFVAILESFKILD
ncbi:MAG: hypothetical protein HY722_08270 [Planctomycetes bacterium]|nr:hypothetical protein [Planctomycetota bacterium]